MRKGASVGIWTILLILLFNPCPSGQDFTNNLNILDMSEFWKIMEKDFQDEGFTKREWVIYGIIAPVVLVIGCVIADWIAK